ncbi:disks large-associated protein 5-like [Anneissia japonica]|uniref:disks large-associated protein 5-like n=1 Tax=Anneissia japonica TaxID=1529436 RepID=UPI001425600E|nr:disks large-associated protein 5-like [Anneissia japonica]
MDRILRLRSPTDYSQDYKKRGISVDKRLLRAHRRTIDQRAQRDKSYMCRRGETYSPPKRANSSTTRPSSKTVQSKITEVPLKERGSTNKQTDKKKNAPNSREEKLKKWKEEKLLKEKLKRNGKENKLFKVCKVKYDNPEFLNVLSKSSHDQKHNRKPATQTNNKKVEVEKKQMKQTKCRVLTTKGSRQSARIAAKKLTEDSMVHTLPDSSFAPKNFIFSAPGNVSTMQFVPMSPCSVQSFFCPNSKFNSTEESSRRCSTPLSAKHSRPLVQALDISMIPNNLPGNVKQGPPDNILAPVFKLTDSITTRLRSSHNDRSAVTEFPKDRPMSVEVINTPTKKECKQNCTQGSNSGIVTSNEILVEQMSKEEDNVHVPSEAIPESKPVECPMSVAIPNIPAEEQQRQNCMQENNSVNVTSNDIIMEEISKDKQNVHVTSEETTEAVSGASLEAKPELSVAYFRSLLKRHTDRLQEVCDKWETELQIDSLLGEEVMGDIRTSIGKAQLLIAQRFKQFNGLIDNCEFDTGLKETSCTDLQGFWEMVYIQIVKKILKKKKVGVAKCTTAASEAAKHRLAAIKAAMKKKQKQQEEEKVVFEGGFFKVESPMKVNKQPHCQGGTPLRKVMQRSLITSPANVSNGSVCGERPHGLQDTSQDRTASPYAFRTPRRSVRTPTARTPASRTRSSAKKIKDQSSLMMNTPVSSSKSPIKTMERNNSFSMFLQRSMNVVDLNNQAEELMVTEPLQQLNALKRTPLSLNRTRGKTPNSYSAKKSSSKNDIKKLDFINNFESPLQLKTSNDPLSSGVSTTEDLICFDSPTPENGENVEYGLVERLAAISLPNKEVIFSPVRRSARFHRPESDDSDLQPQPLDKILFFPLKEI